MTIAQTFRRRSMVICIGLVMACQARISSAQFEFLKDPNFLHGIDRPAEKRMSIGGGETELQIEFIRTAGDGGVVIALPFGARTCALVLDLPDKDGKLHSGIDRVDGKRFFDPTNPVSIDGPTLTTGKKHRVHLLSLRDEVKLALDETSILHYRGSPDSIGKSPLLPNIPPAQKMMMAIDSDIRIIKTKSKMAGVWTPFPKEVELGQVEQFPAAGEAKEQTKYALQILGAPVSVLPAENLIDFQKPFTVEFWFRRHKANANYAGILSGSIEVEFNSEKETRAYLGHGGGGNSGNIRPIENDDWHHLAVCNDRYYIMLYLDGEYVCRGNTSYFYETSPSLRFANKYSKGHRSSGFRGDIRSIRFSSIDRYPLGQAFNPPKVFGEDEHCLARIRFDESLPDVDSKVGRIQLLGSQMKIIDVDSGQ